MPPNGQATIEAILIRIRRQSDFPAMAQTVSVISKFKASEEGSANELANIILKDYSLTSKILKLVNSAGYLQYGEVTTVSRGIMLLGFENIRNIAVALMLLDQLGGRPGSAIRELLFRSVHSGVMAQQIAQELRIDSEEAFICSLFHTFGKIMVAFYLPEKAEEIRTLAEREGSSEDGAALQALGASYEAIGNAVAEAWHFPKRITYAMKTLRPSDIGENQTEIERLCSISNFSNEITRIIAVSGTPEDRDQQLARLMGDYQAHYGAVEEKLGDIITGVAGEVMEYARLFKLPAESVAFIGKITAPDSTDTTAADMAGAESPAAGVDSIANLLKSDAPDTPESLFSKGVLEINTAILNNEPLNDIIRIALETIYRGLQKSSIRRVLFLLRDPRQSVMRLKFGFGAEVSELREWFGFPLAGTADIFNAAVTRNSDAVIRDLAAPVMQPQLPAWFAGKVPPETYLILLPIVINAKPLGLFYIEGARDGFGSLAREDLKHLTLLRDQTVLAIRQKHGT